MVKLYRKKPVVIEAIQYTGTNVEEVKNFTNNNCKVEIYDAGYQARFTFPVAKITIPTLEGEMEANVNDYIIKGVKGEFYPCKPDIFEQTYEEVINETH